MTALSTPRLSFPLRQWATPLVVGAFLIMAATGVGMFFHLETDLMKGLHEWAGWAMVAGGAAHLWLNWRAFTTYFKRPVAGAIMGLGAMLLAMSLLPIGGAAGPGAAIEAMIGTVEDAPVTMLAELTGQEVGAVIAGLEAAGLTGVAPQSTVAGLSGGDRGVEFAALAAVFAPQAE
jgi:hypothetical protein